MILLSVSEGRLVASPIRTPKTHLKQLLAKVTKSNLHDEADMGPAVGRESW